jgi:manganese/zinc-transporting P-type ATPase C
LKTRPAASLKGLLLNAAGLTFFMLFALIRNLSGRSPFSGRTLSVTTAFATLGAIPLLSRTVRDVQKGKKISLFSFLTAACTLAIATGEAMTALEIIWILSIGMFLEEYVSEKAKRAISDVLQILPERAFILENGVEREVELSQVLEGSRLCLIPNRKIPVDGTIEEGEALVDESGITGRALPEFRKKADKVYAGTMVVQGSFVMTAQRTGYNTYISRIAQLVDESLAANSEIEQRADILATRLTKLGLADGG